MYHLIKNAVALIFFLQLLTAHALDLTKVNISYHYDLSDEMTFEYRVVQEPNNLVVYYEVSAPSFENWDRDFLLQSDYESAGHDTLTNVQLDTVLFESGRLICKISLGAPGDKLLLISYSDLNRGLYRVFDVPVHSPAGFPTFLPTYPNGLPILTSYIGEEQVYLKSSNGTHHVFSYTDDFEAADPAMGLMKAIAPTLKVDSFFRVENTLNQLELYKFYLIQEDSFSDNGITLLRTPSYYPEYKRLEELVGPLTYITTPNEKNALTNQMTKRSFEDFWLKTFNTKLRAKSAIKRFYDKVETANRLFTSYKQGWKTDRGMIHIVFGRPDVVIRSDRSEVWRYKSGPEFEFIRISTLFTPSLYSLKRDRRYENTWYDQVSSIRKGL